MCSPDGSLPFGKMALSSENGFVESSNFNFMLIRRVLNVELVLVVLPERRKFPRVGLWRSLGEGDRGDEEVVDLRCCGE